MRINRKLIGIPSIRKDFKKIRIKQKNKNRLEKVGFCLTITCDNKKK